MLVAAADGICSLLTNVACELLFQQSNCAAYFVQCLCSLQGFSLILESPWICQWHSQALESADVPLRNYSLTLTPWKYWTMTSVQKSLRDWQY